MIENYYEFTFNALLLCFTLLAIFFLNKKSFKIWQWRKRLNLKQHEQIFQKLYQGVDGFALSKYARRHNDACEYVYGEIEFESFIALLSLCHLSHDSVFYDLGSGTGKAVIAAAMVFPLKQSIGVELFPILHEAAVLQQQKLASEISSHSIAATIHFINADFLNLNYQSATLLFINATAFFDQYWRTISVHLENCLLPNTLVLSTSKALHSSHFLTLKTTFLAMSWGTVEVFIQKRI